MIRIQEIKQKSRFIKNRDFSQNYSLLHSKFGFILSLLRHFHSSGLLLLVNLR